MRKYCAVILICAMALCSVGCYGTFTLTKKVYTWNGSVGDKYISTFVMWAFMIIPVYGACGFIDFVVLNTIEFWVGSNPLALKNSEIQEKTIVSGDKTYKVSMGNMKMHIEQIAGPQKGQAVELLFDTQSPSVQLKANGISSTIVSVENNIVKLHNPNGTTHPAFAMN